MAERKWLGGWHRDLCEDGDVEHQPGPGGRKGRRRRGKEQPQERILLHYNANVHSANGAWAMLKLYGGEIPEAKGEEEPENLVDPEEDAESASEGDGDESGED